MNPVPTLEWQLAEFTEDVENLGMEISRQRDLKKLMHSHERLKIRRNSC